MRGVDEKLVEKKRKRKAVDRRERERMSQGDRRRDEEKERREGCCFSFLYHAIISPEYFSPLSDTI